MFRPSVKDRYAITPSAVIVVIWPFGPAFKPFAEERCCSLPSVTRRVNIPNSKLPSCLDVGETLIPARADRHDPWVVLRQTTHGLSCTLVAILKLFVVYIPGS